MTVLHSAIVIATTSLVLFPFIPALDAVAAYATFALSITLGPFISIALPQIHFDHYAFFLERLIGPVANLTTYLAPRAARPWIDAFSMRTQPFCVLAISICGMLLLGRLLDRRIHDRALAAWNEKWRATRYVTSIQRNRGRVLVATMVAVLSTMAVYQFYAVTVRDCGGLGTGFLDCIENHFAPIRLTLENSFDEDGRNLDVFSWGVAFAAYSSAWGLLGLWILYQLRWKKMAKEYSAEVPSFALWIARNARSSTLAQHLHYFGERMIPPAFALALVGVLLTVLNRASYEVLNASGYFCPDDSNRRLQKIPKEGLSVTLPYQSFCADLNVELLGYADRYQFTIDRDEEADALESPPWFAWPFRRNLSASWYDVIVKEGQFGDTEYILDENYRPNLDKEITTWDGPEPIRVYFYVNGITLGIPGLNDLFYRHMTGKVTIKIVPAEYASETVQPNALLH
jgi:hypothetical protein